MLIPMIGIVVGSESDWPVMKAAADTLKLFNVPFEHRIISAHRDPTGLYRYAAGACDRSLKAIIAGAGGAAHLPGMLAAMTVVPVLGVPMPSPLGGIDSLLSIVQMPRGTPVGTLSIGEAGAVNAALLAVAFLANNDRNLQLRLLEYRQQAAAEADKNLQL